MSPGLSACRIQLPAKTVIEMTSCSLNLQGADASGNISGLRKQSAILATSSDCVLLVLAINLTALHTPAHPGAKRMFQIHSFNPPHVIDRMKKSHPRPVPRECGGQIQVVHTFLYLLGESAQGDRLSARPSACSENWPEVSYRDLQTKSIKVLSLFLFSMLTRVSFLSAAIRND
jgi:hypothetical protein